MAKALVMRIEQGYIDKSVPYLSVGVLYYGVDVPNNMQIKSLNVTVAANLVFLPSYAAA